METYQIPTAFYPFPCSEGSKATRNVFFVAEGKDWHKPRDSNESKLQTLNSKPVALQTQNSENKKL